MVLVTSLLVHHSVVYWLEIFFLAYLTNGLYKCCSSVANFFSHYASRDVSAVLLGTLHCGNVQVCSTLWVLICGLGLWSCKHGHAYVTEYDVT